MRVNIQCEQAVNRKIIRYGEGGLGVNVENDRFYGNVVCIGDSMYRFLSLYLGVLVYFFPGAEVGDILQKVLNGGISKRVLIDSDIIFIHLGTNNIGNGTYKNVKNDMERLVDALMAINPTVKIVISGILPRPCDFNITNPIVTEVNRELASWCKYNNCKFIKTNFIICT